MTRRCGRCHGTVYEDEPGVWLHILVGKACIIGEVRPVDTVR